MSSKKPAPIFKPRWITSDTTLSTASDVRRLDDAPDGFREYLVSEVKAIEKSGCTPEILIYVMHPDGFAYGAGGSSDCGGGAVIIWSDQSGSWEQLLATQNVIDCRDLANAGVPTNTGVLECLSKGQTRFW